MPESLYGLIHEPDPKAAPRFRLRVNGRWIDIQLAEAFLIHEIVEAHLNGAREAIKARLVTGDPYELTRDLYANKRGGLLEIDFDGGTFVPSPGTTAH